MANVLKVAVVHAIIGLLDQDWSYRRIARELGVHRETVARYDRLRQSPSGGAPNIGAPGFRTAGRPTDRDGCLVE